MNSGVESEKQFYTNLRKKNNLPLWHFASTSDKNSTIREVIKNAQLKAIKKLFKEGQREKIFELLQKETRTIDPTFENWPLVREIAETLELGPLLERRRALLQELTVQRCLVQLEKEIRLRKKYQVTQNENEYANSLILKALILAAQLSESQIDPALRAER